MTYTELIEAAYKTQCEFHVGKNKTYGDSCFKVNIFGQQPEAAILARVADKIERIKFITSGGDAGGETLDDAIRDLIGYLVALQIVRAEARGVNLGEKGTIKRMESKMANFATHDLPVATLSSAAIGENTVSDMVRNFKKFLEWHSVIAPVEIQELQNAFIASWKKHKCVNVLSHYVFIGPDCYAWHQIIAPEQICGKWCDENKALAAAIKAHIGQKD